MLSPLGPPGELSRRMFLGRGLGLFSAATLAERWATDSALAADRSDLPPAARPKARAQSVIFLNMVGGPPQMDLFDYKPKLRGRPAKDLARTFASDHPDAVAEAAAAAPPAQRRTDPSQVAPTRYEFRRHGQSGMWVSELLPWTAKMVDDLCFVRSMQTEAAVHAPAMDFLLTGSRSPGRPSLGAWASYGLASRNEALPKFVVLLPRARSEGLQIVPSHLWGAGFLPGEHAGVPFRSRGEPIFYLNNPPGVTDEVRRTTIAGIEAFDQLAFERLHDPEIRTRGKQYAAAARMQGSCPELLDLKQEPASTFELYGPGSRESGTFAHSAVLARRLVERGVRFVQLCHNNWDVHNNLASALPVQCRDVDRACYGLVQDLKQRGLLDTTLVVWGGEFGRTILAEGGLMNPGYGRDHHPLCFTVWLAGGGVRPGTIYGETDDFCYKVAKGPVHVRDFHATLLYLLGFDHRELSYRYQGIAQTLTGFAPVRVVHEILL